MQNLTRNGELIHSDTVWERALSMNLSALFHIMLHIPPSFVHRDNNSVWEEGMMGGIQLPSQPLRNLSYMTTGPSYIFLYPV